MRWLIVVVVVVLSCAACGATMTRPVRTDSEFAPVNEGSGGGQVKYLADGAAFVVEGRRKDAYKQMHDACGGAYRIIEEHASAEGAVASETGGVAYAVPMTYEFITFECVR